MSALTHAYVQTNGIRMHYVTEGEGPVVVLLHGFPQYWYTWRHQIPALAAHFRVVVPDLRGYGDTDKPTEIADYQADNLAKDIVGLIQGLGYTKAHIVGHDWGGTVAWRLGHYYPEVVDRLIVINSPHPKLFREALKHSFQQMRKSWYIAFFQLPYLPEWILQRDPKKTLMKLFRGTAFRKDTFTDDDIQNYVEAFEKPGVIPAALNYYRAAFRTSSKPQQKGLPIAAPTLLIWGEEDKVLGKELTEGMVPLFSSTFKRHFIPNCGHWVPEEQPDLVNKLILEFLGTK